MGDAAHASGPNIGQGVNISLGDAAALASLLLKMVRRFRVIRNQLFVAPAFDDGMTPSDHVKRTLRGQGLRIWYDASDKVERTI